MHRGNGKDALWYQNNGTGDRDRGVKSGVV